uniref:Uncharacterized protein LOC111123172 n=1 Tax=Crassostrea virginica TaxID=6565 RepID=A0A8B8CYZ7_CRAVI|nr:uncharacterized protein LOC111123172 [Crassostrea virginica]
MTVGGDSSTTTTTPTPLKDPLPSKQMILAISGGVGGALLLIIIISSVCFCRRLQHAKKRQGSFSETSSKCNSDVIRENKTMENIPLELGNSNAGFREEMKETDLRYPSDPTLPSSKKNPLYRDSSDDERMGYHQTEREPRYQDNFKTLQESLNVQKFPERPRANSRGDYRQHPAENSYYREPENPQRHQREPENDYRPPNRGHDVDDRRERASTGTDFDSNKYVYIEGDGGVRRLFKRVEEEGSAGSTLIYQPSNMPRPIQRENVGSVGDNFSMRAGPPVDERRSSFYDTIDTESTYKIQRPTIKHNNLYS